jgi:hypothetical protein
MQLEVELRTTGTERWDWVPYARAERVNKRPCVAVRRDPRNCTRSQKAVRSNVHGTKEDL